jgi:hypothetical protein
MDSFSSVRKYSVADARAAMPGMDEHGVGWLEEPFPAHDYRSYIEAKGFGRMLAQEFQTAWNQPVVVDKRPGQFAQHLKSEIAKWGKVVREAKIRVD